MSSRDTILKAVSQNKPEQVAIPAINVNNTYEGKNLATIFAGTLQFIGGIIKTINNFDDLKKEIEQKHLNHQFIVNTIPELGITDSEIDTESSAVELEKIEVSYIYGQLGVAENGSIWIDDTNLPNRLLPFICQHLVIILNTKNIVANMHVAYSTINTFNTGYGLFIAGPSKTADIEQSLVIGAHGARSLTVYLLEN